MKTVKIKTEFITLGALLKYADVADLGSDAKAMIAAGKVKLNGTVETQRGKKIRPGDRVEAAGAVIEVVKD